MPKPDDETWAAVLRTLAAAGVTRPAVARKLGVRVDLLDTLVQFRLPRTTHAGMTGLGETARAIGTTVEALREVLEMAER